MALCSYYRILVRNSLADLEEGAEGESIQKSLFLGNHFRPRGVLTQ